MALPTTWHLLHLSTSHKLELLSLDLHSMKLSHVRWLAIGCSVRAWHRIVPRQISTLLAPRGVSTRSGAAAEYQHDGAVRTRSRVRRKLTATNAAKSSYHASQGALRLLQYQSVAFRMRSVRTLDASSQSLKCGATKGCAQKIRQGSAFQPRLDPN